MLFKGFEGSSSWFDPKVIEVNNLTETCLLLVNILIKKNTLGFLWIDIIFIIYNKNIRSLRGRKKVCYLNRNFKKEISSKNYTWFNFQTILNLFHLFLARIESMGGWRVFIKGAHQNRFLKTLPHTYWASSWSEVDTEHVNVIISFQLDNSILQYSKFYFYFTDKKNKAQRY